MTEPALLHAAARIPLADPHAMLRRLCAHFTEHGTVTVDGNAGRIESRYGVAVIEAGDDALNVRAECPGEAALYLVKASLAEHIAEFAGETPEFSWTGDHAGDRTIPYFRAMTVRGARNITPNMRRVTLAGADVGHFETGGLHVRVLIPPRGRTPVWPSAGHDGRVVWPKGEDELVCRVYTVRAIDHARGEIDVDVVLHDGNHTPGSAWAVSARPGDPVGIMGPGGGDLPAVSDYLLVGDETALPAIARIAETLSPEQRATIVIEVADRGEEQAIASAARIDLRWLHRGNAPAGTTSALQDAVRGFDWPSAKGDLHVLACCEHRSAKAIRAFLRKERGLPKSAYVVAAYWRRDYQGDQSDDHD